MTEQQRRSILFTALAGAAAWSIWLALNEPATDNNAIELAKPVAHANHSARADTRTASAQAQATPQETAPRLALSQANLFPEQTWYIPPPPPPPRPYVPPPPPQAPALPFSYMGRWQQADQTTYYLMRGLLPVSVRPGQVLDGVWQLETVVNGALNFTYLPLKQTRSLRTGE